MLKQKISARSASSFIYLFTEKKNEELVFQPSIKCVIAVRKKVLRKSIFVACTIKRSKLQPTTRATFSPRTIAKYPRKRASGGEGRRRKERGPVPRHYFSPFVNDVDVNCGRFDRAFERAVTTVTFTRDVSRSLRLPPFKTLVNGTSCRVEEKRETRNVSDTK